MRETSSNLGVGNHVGAGGAPSIKEAGLEPTRRFNYCPALGIWPRQFLSLAPVIIVFPAPLVQVVVSVALPTYEGRPVRAWGGRAYIGEGRDPWAFAKRVLLLLFAGVTSLAYGGQCHTNTVPDRFYLSPPRERFSDGRFTSSRPSLS